MIGKRGDIERWIQIAKGPGSLAANPAALSGAAVIMTQLAMQQAMDEITPAPTNSSAAWPGPPVCPGLCYCRRFDSLPKLY